VQPEGRHGARAGVGETPLKRIRLGFIDAPAPRPFRGAAIVPHENDFIQRSGPDAMARRAGSDMT
jgi:hypothetical protein